MIQDLRAMNVDCFAVRVKMSNYCDREAAERGLIEASALRSIATEAFVDARASRMVVPARIAKELGLKPSAKVKVKYADGRSATRDAVDGVYLEIAGRHGVFSAIVEPRRRDALIGAIVLEDLDFLIDPKRLRLVPRDPDFVISEIE